MRRLFLLVGLLTTAACSSPSASKPLPRLYFTPVAPTPLPTPSPAPPTDITLGDTIEGVYGDGKTPNPGQYRYALATPASGTLTATLTWDPDYVGTLLMLTVDDRPFSAVKPAWSPVVAQLPVEAGQQSIVISLQGADWLPQDRFQLSTRLDR